MKDTIESRFAEVARHAVGRTLLRRKSPRGGAYGVVGLDEARAEEVYADIEPDELYALLMEVATEAASEAQMEADHQRRITVIHVEQQAVKSDSLSLWRFAQQMKEN